MVSLSDRARGVVFSSVQQRSGRHEVPRHVWSRAYFYNAMKIKRRSVTCFSNAIYDQNAVLRYRPEGSCALAPRPQADPPVFPGLLGTMTDSRQRLS